DGRKMIDFGLPVAVATDFNPGTAPSKNIFLAMSLACLEMGLNFEEVLTAVTINAASALNLSDKIGSLEKGKMADIAIFDVDDYKEIPYWLGENLVKKVIIGGKVVK
ncbi:MAG: amidohydrolase family protein, partial [Patescibacteria group bacterium]